jgi:hypothetical protein
MRYLAFLLLSVPLSTSVPAQQPAPHSNTSAGSSSVDVKQIVQGTREVMDLSECGWHRERYRDLFNAVNPGDLGALQGHQDDTVAVRAAWQSVVLTVPVKGSANSLRPARGRLNWFLGFLEGRLRVQMPTWWTEALLDCRAVGGDSVYPGRFERPPYHEAGMGGLHAPEDTTLNEEGNAVILTVGDQSASVPKKLFGKTASSGHERDVTALMTPSRCYVAVHGQVGYPYDLACVDRSSAKLLWRSTVRGTWWGFSNGFHEMRVMLTEQDERVVIFGCSGTGIHVEVFRSADGLALSRFASSY